MLFLSYQITQYFFHRLIWSNEKDEVCHRFLVEIFTKSLNRGGVFNLNLRRFTNWKQTNLKLVVFTCVKSLDMSCFYYHQFFVWKCQILIDNLSTSTKFALITPRACYCLIPPIKLSDFTYLTADWLLLIFEVQRKVEWVLSKSFCKTQLGHS